VAVVHAADELSAATGTRYSPEGCHLTTAGEVYLSPPSSSNASGAMSSLQLLAALLGKPTSAHELRALVVAVDTTSAAEGDARLRLDLRWCLSADPKADVARLASRALAAEPGPGRGSGAQPEKASPPAPAAKPRKPMASGDVADRQRHALTLRVPRLSLGWIAAITALLLALAGGIAAVGAFIGRIEQARSSPAAVAVDDQRPLPTNAR
jgi:hypothetical protein